MRIDTAGRVLLWLIATGGLVAGVFSLFIDHEVSAVEGLWQRFDAQRSEKVRTLDALYASLGYGGMIHRLKDLVLRQQDTDGVLGQADLGAAEAALRRYASLGVDAAEQRALEALRQTLERYRAALEEAREHADRGVTAQAIDAAVRVDDAPAFIALARLDARLRQQDAGCSNACRPQLLSGLHRILGYGGLIHHFKNFVLRGDIRYLQGAREKLLEAEEQFSHYRHLKLRPEEQRAIEALSGVLAQYAERLGKVQALLRGGADPARIDAEVRVDDGPARNALVTLLRESVAEGEHEAKQVYAALGSARVLAYANLVSSLLLAVILIAAAWWLIRRRIVLPIESLTGIMGRLAADELDTAIPETRQRNEIGDMAIALQVFKDNAHARRLAESELRAILDNALDGIIVIDESGVIHDANPAACGVFGYTATQLVGRNVNILMPAPHAGAHDGYIRRYLNGGEPGVIGKIRELEGLRNSGSRFPLELGVNEVRREEGRLFIGMVRDITERKRLERMKTEFVSTVSHELRTPLTSIMGSLGLVRGGAVGELPEKAGQMLEIAHNNAERLVRLINDILDTEKIDSGRMEFSMEALKLGELLDRAVAENRGYADRHQVTLIWPGTEPDLEVRGDRDRLLQVMANLLSNAVKYSPRGGQVEVALDAQNGRGRIQVTDQGPGIPEAFRTRIFQRFSQADSSDSRSKGGTGLGLAISKAIVEQHGGSIGFDTREGKGSRFHVSLPLLARLPATAPPAGAERGRVLVCEDDRDVARLLQILLRQEGLASDVALDAEQAKRMLAEREYAAMTLDLILPGQDGIALLRELREQARTRDLPVVVVSAKATEGRRELNGGAVSILDWIDKPVDPERLLAVLRRLAPGHDGGRPRILHVEDDPDVAAVVGAVVGEVAEVEVATTLAEARRCLEHDGYQLVILDLILPDGHGEELLPLLRQRAGGSIPVIVFSARELDTGAAESVSDALVKSLTNNEQLLESILNRIGAANGKGNS